MTRKRIMLGVVLVAAAIAVGLQNYVFFSQMADDVRPIADELDEALEDEVDVAEASLAPIPPEQLAAWLSAQPGPGRSPFLTRAEAEALGEAIPATLPRLAGTLTSNGRRVAWLDGRPHSEGDWVDGHQIERIRRTGIVLVSGKTRIELPLSRARLPDPEGITDAR